MLNYSNKPQYDLLEEAKDEEAILETAEIKELPTSGKRVINLKFKIRDDIEQPNKGRVIFDTIWPDKKNPNDFDSRKINALLLVKGEDGKYDFEDYDELVQYINGFLLRISIEKKPADEYHEEPYNQVKYCSYKPTQAGMKSIPSGNSMATPTKASNDTVTLDVDDDDENLPF